MCHNNGIYYKFNEPDAVKTLKYIVLDSLDIYTDKKL